MKGTGGGDSVVNGDTERVKEVVRVVSFGWERVSQS
jgi:hypothetical protein